MSRALGSPPTSSLHSPPPTTKMRLSLLLNPEVKVAAPPSHQPSPTLLSQVGSAGYAHVGKDGGAGPLHKLTDMVPAQTPQFFGHESGATHKIGAKLKEFGHDEAFEEQQWSDAASVTDDGEDNCIVGFSCVDENDWEQQPRPEAHQHSFHAAADEVMSEAESSIYDTSPMSCSDTCYASFQDVEEEMWGTESSTYVQSPVSVRSSVEVDQAWLGDRPKSKFQDATDDWMPVFQCDPVQTYEQVAAETAANKKNKPAAKKTGKKAARRKPKPQPDAEPKPKKSSNTMEERIAALESDPMVYSFEETRVICGGCKRPIRMDGRSLYYPGLWIKHRGRCVGVQKKLAEMKIEEENNNRYTSMAGEALQEDPLVPRTSPSKCIRIERERPALDCWTNSLRLVLALPGVYFVPGGMKDYTLSAWPSAAAGDDPCSIRFWHLSGTMQASIWKPGRSTSQIRHYWRLRRRILRVDDDLKAVSGNFQKVAEN
ncbi:hypothetical protein C8R43DRAFT_963193 [Mycena crocata]|nr:hypothetical protein C8R43DRAFT_963193 [Mycena crocata]